ncbi:MAG: LacI family DNA-binding transcriptional regulator [Sphingorhabdus sp.]
MAPKTTNENSTARARKIEKPVTSYDVAKLAGVSQSAVSRAFTPGASVAKATRAKIMGAVDALGYQPNAIARSLITKRSNMVAIIVANIGYHPELTASLSRRFTEHGMHILLFTVEHESEADHVVDQIWQYRVDGVIAAVHLTKHHIETFAKRKMPLVFINRLYPDVASNSVCCDQVQGESMLVDRLVAAGHKRFGIVSGPADSVVSSQRVDGALARLKVAGIDNVAVCEGNFDYRSGRHALINLTQQAGRAPDAVLCANDLMAIGCIDAARCDLGLDVPNDISIVGFDGLDPASWENYRLVTIRQPLDTMVAAAVDMLLARVEDYDIGTERRMFSGTLIEGQSARIGE